jgi:hypothetical protein
LVTGFTNIGARAVRKNIFFGYGLAPSGADIYYCANNSRFSEDDWKISAETNLNFKVSP